MNFSAKRALEIGEFNNHYRRLRTSAKPGRVVGDADLGRLQQYRRSAAFLEEFQEFLPGLVKFRFVQHEFLANAAQLGKIGVGFAPKSFRNSELLARCG